MLQHPGIEFQLQGFFKGVHFTAFVARLLHHAKDPVVSLDMIVGALAIFPPQKDDHVGKLVLSQSISAFETLPYQVFPHGIPPRSPSSSASLSGRGRLALAPKIPWPNVPVAMQRIGVTASRREHMAANVVHPQHGWYILPQILQRQTLHLFVKIESLIHVHLLRRLVQEAVDLRLYLGVCRTEFVAFVL